MLNFGKLLQSFGAAGPAPRWLGSDTDSVLGWAAFHQGWTLRPMEGTSLVSRS